MKVVLFYKSNTCSFVFTLCCSCSSVREISEQLKQTNVDDNQNDREVASYMSKSDGSAVSDSLACPFCDLYYSPETGYYEHLKIHHSKKKCTECKVEFNSHKLYIEHMEGHKERAIQEDKGMTTNEDKRRAIKGRK